MEPPRYLYAVRFPIGQHKTKGEIKSFFPIVTLYPWIIMEAQRLIRMEARGISLLNSVRWTPFGELWRNVGPMMRTEASLASPSRR
ncbi:hypothetical protein Pelo_18846 [Pelomyxa schiedti]|nr:hypothetical protein Pelo_18846 [Pelomyxa schiedti]